MTREEAISLLQRGVVGEIYNEKGYLTTLGYEALDAIDSSNCPKLVQKRHGAWIDVNGDGSIMKCSVCGDMVCCKNNNFCPNCGADMRKRGEAEWNV